MAQQFPAQKNRTPLLQFNATRRVTLLACPAVLDRVTSVPQNSGIHASVKKSKTLEKPVAFS
jgi:hypothetical protein